MQLKTRSIDVPPCYLDLTCPRCRAATIRYWPAYDEPGDILCCSECASLYELTDGCAGTITPFEPSAGGAPQLRREPRR
jgi:hypothetical protein